MWVENSVVLGYSYLCITLVIRRQVTVLFYLVSSATDHVFCPIFYPVTFFLISSPGISFLLYYLINTYTMLLNPSFLVSVVLIIFLAIGTGLAFYAVLKRYLEVVFREDIHPGLHYSFQDFFDTISN